MKKVIALILCFLCFNMFAPSFALTKAALIEDTFVNSTLSNKNFKIQKHEFNLIEESIPNTNKKIEVKKTQLIEETLPKNVSYYKSKKKVLLDDFEEDKTPIKVKIKAPYSTKQSTGKLENRQFDEGDYIDFELAQDIELNKKKYSKGTPIKARIENISQNAIYGVPSDVVIANFELDDNSLEGEIKKQGANRSLWVYPLTYAMDIFFGAGLAFMFIRGGHAKIKTNEIYTIYYCK